jgi:hypothetical protein
LAITAHEDCKGPPDSRVAEDVIQRAKHYSPRQRQFLYFDIVALTSFTSALPDELTPSA